MGDCPNRPVASQPRQEASKDHLKVAALLSHSRLSGLRKPQYCSLNDSKFLGDIEPAGGLSPSGTQVVVAHLPLDSTGVQSSSTGDNPLIENFVENCFMQDFPAPRGDSAVAGHTSLDNANGVEKRESVGVFIGLERGFVHQAADGEMGQPSEGNFSRIPLSVQTPPRPWPRHSGQSSPRQIEATPMASRIC